MGPLSALTPPGAELEFVPTQQGRVGLRQELPWRLLARIVEDNMQQAHTQKGQVKVS